MVYALSHTTQVDITRSLNSWRKFRILFLFSLSVPSINVLYLADLAEQFFLNHWGLLYSLATEDHFVSAPRYSTLQSVLPSQTATVATLSQ